MKVKEPQPRLVGHVRVSSLRCRWHRRDICLGHSARVIRHDAFAFPCHQCGTSRVTCAGKGCMMAVFSVSRHLMASLSALRPRRSERSGSCSPSRGIVLAPAACWHKVHGSQNVRRHDFSTFTCAHYHRQQTVGRTMQTVRKQSRTIFCKQIAKQEP